MSERPGHSQRSCALFGGSAGLCADEPRWRVASVSKAAWHYARAVALVEQGQPESAEAEARKIALLQGKADIEALEAAFLPAKTILEISIRTIEARVAARAGDFKKAIGIMEAVADMQDTLPYSEPPLWYYPTRQTLAALLLQDGQLDRAERMFRRTLLDSPNNAHALYGLWQTYKAMGDTQSANYAKALYRKAWLGGWPKPPVAQPDLTHFPEPGAGRLHLQIHVPAIGIFARFRLGFQRPDFEVGEWHFSGIALRFSKGESAIIPERIPENRLASGGRQRTPPDTRKSQLFVFIGFVR